MTVCPVEGNGVGAVIAIERTHTPAPVAVQRLYLEDVRAVLRQQLVLCGPAIPCVKSRTLMPEKAR